MVLPPLEFSECYLDSPWFRENIQKYEVELERTNSQIKQLIKDAKSMITAFKNQAKMMNLFNLRLQNFQFDCIGENLTDDEKLIAGSLKEFGLMLQELSGEWKRTIERAELQLITPLEGFRKEHIYSFRDSKKSFEKASERYYKQLEHTLALSHKKKDQQLQDSDSELQNLRKIFHSESLHYVYKLQEVQERKKFEFVENLLMFMQVYFNYLHQTHETAADYKEYMRDLQVTLVATRERYSGTQSQTRTLMTKMAESPDVAHPGNERLSRAGYLFLMEKNSISARLASKWTKYYCWYRKENQLFQMMSPHHTSSNVTSSVGAKVSSLNFSSNSGLIEPLTLKGCTRRINETIDKRFCFDLELEDQAGRLHTLTLQAVSELDCKKWLTVMGGKEPQIIQHKEFSAKRSYGVLNEQGLNFCQDLIAEIERRGVDHEGIYRLVGVTSKVDNLLRQALDPNNSSSIDLSNSESVETNTMTSALKSYLRNLPEPLMTFDLHRSFIDAAKCERHKDRVTRIAALVAKLPNLNRLLLHAVAQHLEKVQIHQEKNKMTVQNLGVCFGPTLLRDKEESVQAIIEIKFSNIIVEILVEEREIIFREPNENKNNNEHIKNVIYPKIQSKTATRLPSQRLKQRPRGGIFDQVTPIPAVAENTIEAHFGENAHQARAILLNNQSSTPPSPALERNSQDRSSQSSDDSLQLSPIDLDLSFIGLTGIVNKTSSPEEEGSAPLAKAESVTSISEVSKVSNPSITSDEITPEPPNKDLDRGDGNGLLEPAPKPKLRISLRRGRHTSSKKKSLRENLKNSTQNANQNNNTTSVKPKPRTLAVSSSIKGAKKKLASAKEGLIGNIGAKKQPTPNYENQWTDFRKPISPSDDGDLFTVRRLRSRHVDSISFESTTPVDERIESVDKNEDDSGRSATFVDKVPVTDMESCQEETAHSSQSTGPTAYEPSVRISSETESSQAKSSRNIRPTPYEIPIYLSETQSSQTAPRTTPYEMSISSDSASSKALISKATRSTPYEVPVRAAPEPDSSKTQTARDTAYEMPIRKFFATDSDNDITSEAPLTSRTLPELETGIARSSRDIRQSAYENPIHIFEKETDKSRTSQEKAPTAYEIPVRTVFDTKQPEPVHSTIAKTLYVCVAEHESELSFEAGQIVRDIRPSDEEGWIYGCIEDGKVGLIPKNYVVFLPQD